MLLCKDKVPVLLAPLCVPACYSGFAADYTISSSATWTNQANIPADNDNLTVEAGVTLTIGVGTNGTYNPAGLTVAVGNNQLVNGTIAGGGRRPDCRLDAGRHGEEFLPIRCHFMETAVPAVSRQAAVRLLNEERNTQR